MSTTSSISTVQSNGAGATNGDQKTLGKDDFLKLLIAQVQHQDPLSPMDNQAFVAQLAQFSNVEQLQGVNSRLDSLALGQAGANQQAAANLVGKSVAFKSNQVHLDSGAPATIGGQLSGAATSVIAVITDASGRTIRTLPLGGGQAGSFSGAWDGRDDAGNLAATGDYTVKLVAADGSGKTVGVTGQSTGKVTGVSFATGAAQLIVNSIRVDLSNVIEVDQAP